MSGASYREIARHPKVRLSCRGVELAIRRALAEDREHVDLLASEARAITLLRLESLLRIGMPRALDGNIRAWEGCRRLVEAEARFLGVDRPELGALQPEPEEEPERDENGMTALDRYRQRHEGA